MSTHAEDILKRLNELIGSKNWVVARRSKRILQKYGLDVVCLSPTRYETLCKQAIADVLVEKMRSHREAEGRQ